jgi:hypothetical protein
MFTVHMFTAFDAEANIGRRVASRHPKAEGSIHSRYAILYHFLETMEGVGGPLEPRYAYYSSIHLIPRTSSPHTTVAIGKSKPAF